MRRLAICFGLVAVLGLTLGTGQAWAQTTTAVPPTAVPPISIYRLPEPGPLIGAGVVSLMGLGYAWLRRKRATA